MWPWFPKPILFIFGDTKWLQLIQERFSNHFRKHFIIGNLNISEIDNFEHVGKTWGAGAANPKDPFIIVWESWRWDQYLSKKWNGHLVIWNQSETRNGHVEYGTHIYQNTKWNLVISIKGTWEFKFLFFN